MRKFAGCSALTLSFMLVEPAAAQTVTLNAEFQGGAIAEYTNGANGAQNGALFSALSISSIAISQDSATGEWGGTQGNDVDVTVTITYNDGTPTLVFPGAINWVKNAGQGNFDWIGITTLTNQNDGYTPPTAGASKTYILQFPQSSADLAALVAANNIGGSANSGGALNALNKYFPGPGSSDFTFSSGSSFTYLENRGDADTIASVRATNAGGTVTYAITGGNADGWYEIDPSTGDISLTPAGVAAAEPNDFEIAPNSRVIQVEATDTRQSGSDVIVQTVTLTESDVNEVAAIAFSSGNAFTYAENSAADTVITTVAASGGSGALTYSISAGNDDGWFAIDGTSGEVTLTAAGAAAAANDFETLANAHVLTIAASDGSSTTSMDVTLSETDVDEGPAFTGTNATDGGGSPSYAFTYAENQAADAVLGQVFASDPDAGASLTYSISAGNDDGWFAIDGSSGEISLTAAGAAAAANDFETTPNAHVLTVAVSDGTNSSTIEAALTESDVNEVAAIAFSSGNAFTYAENSAADTVITTVAASGGSGALTYSISAGNDDGWFAIDGTSGEVTLTAAGAAAAANDFETLANAHVLTIAASDGSSTTSMDVTLSETDLDDSAPVIGGAGGNPGDATASVSVPEGSTAVASLTADEGVT
ncbi:cadherin repeat domain-containing protein, partial [Sphingomicrobium aestuariivivum]|nr:cadherin repeat domain-containing protein [Sphingomicrobium aestuariivivum]